MILSHMYKLRASRAGCLRGLGLGSFCIFLWYTYIRLPGVADYPLLCKDLSVSEVDWNFSLGRVWNDLF
jgi:hypothetical protein